MLRKEMIPSYLIIVMGVLDCATTLVGVLYSGAKELNPLMAGILSSNVGIFMIVKLAGTVFVATSYILARRLLMGIPDKTTKSFNNFFQFMRVSYAAVIVFLFMVIANNVLILIK